jgi:hypothetical protein
MIAKECNLNNREIAALAKKGAKAGADGHGMKCAASVRPSVRRRLSVLASSPTWWIGSPNSRKHGIRSGTLDGTDRFSLILPSWSMMQAAIDRRDTSTAAWNIDVSLRLG